METILTELLATLSTEEVLRMPGLFQSCYAFVENWSIAVGASWREQVVVVRLAVGPAVALEEVPGAQLLVAVSAGEVLRVPRATQRGDDLSDDGLIAGVAASLLGGLYSLAAHVCSKGSEHML